MKKINKFILLIFTIWIPLYISFYLINFTRMWLNYKSNALNPQNINSLFDIISPLHIFTIIFSFILIIFYLINIIRMKESLKKPKHYDITGQTVNNGYESIKDFIQLDGMAFKIEIYENKIKSFFAGSYFLLKNFIGNL